jgi:mono/diheme cytochrome c family protein
MRNEWASTFTTIRFLSIVSLLTVTFFAPTTILVTAQEGKVKKVPITQSDPTSGKQMFHDYCAACHGTLGNGDGPAAPFLKTPPADLTLLAKKNGRNFPTDHVTNVLQFGIPTTAHGSKDMPVWGELFKSLSASHGTERAESALRIHRLSEYIKTLQAR